MSPVLRAAGLLPLLFVALHAAHYASVGGLAHMLWPCHAANVLLGLGLLGALPGLVRVAVPWIVAGLGPWIFDMASTGERMPTSFLSHLGGTAVGLLALRRIGADARAWLPGLGLWLVLQAAAWAMTDPARNVNLVDRPYAGLEPWFPSWPIHQLATLGLVAGVLALTASVLARIFPPHGDGGRDPCEA